MSKSLVYIWVGNKNQIDQLINDNKITSLNEFFGVDCLYDYTISRHLSEFLGASWSLFNTHLVIMDDETLLLEQLSGKTKILANLSLSNFDLSKHISVLSREERSRKGLLKELEKLKNNFLSKHPDIYLTNKSSVFDFNLFDKNSRIDISSIYYDIPGYFLNLGIMNGFINGIKDYNTFLQAANQLGDRYKESEDNSTISVARMVVELFKTKYSSKCLVNSKLRNF